MNIVDMKPILPLSGDIVFKGFFGDKKRIKFLVNLINYYTNMNIQEGQVLEVEIPEQVPLHSIDKMSRLDLLVKTDTGECINVEVQIEKYEHLLKRIQYYHHKVFASQLNAGDDYGKLSRTISIIYVDKHPDFFDDDMNYINHIVYSHEESGKIFKEMGMFIFVEYSKMVAEDDIWARLMAAKTDEDFKQLEERGGIMAEAIQELRYFSQNEKVRYAQMMREKYERDQLSLRNQARREGKIEGKQEMAKDMLSMGYSIEDVKKITGFSEQKLKSLYG